METEATSVDDEATQWFGHPWYKVLQYGGLAGFWAGAVVEYLTDPPSGLAGIGFYAIGAGLAVGLIGAGGERRARRGKAAAPLLAVAVFSLLSTADLALGSPLMSSISATIGAAGLFGGMPGVVPTIVSVAVLASLVVTPAYLVLRHLEPPVPGGGEARAG